MFCMFEKKCNAIIKSVKQAVLDRLSCRDESPARHVASLRERNTRIAKGGEVEVYICPICTEETRCLSGRVGILIVQTPLIKSHGRNHEVSSSDHGPSHSLTNPPRRVQVLVVHSSYLLQGDSVLSKSLPDALNKKKSNGQ